MSMGSFLDRFVHPRLAAVVVVGITLWGGSFLIAATGLALQPSGDAPLVATLFFVSGIVGVLGMAIVSGCGLWLGGLRTIQIVRRRRK